MAKKVALAVAMTLLSVPPLAAFAQINQSSTDSANSQSTATLEDESDFLTYENATLGISIQYPSSWLKGEEESGLMFVSPPDENNFEASSVILDLKILNWSLFSLSPSGQLSLGDYVNSTIQDWIALNSTIIESNSTTLQTGNDNNTVHKIVLSTQDEEDGLTFHQMHIYAVRDSKLYQIIYSGEVGKYSIYLPVVENMIDSFKTIDHIEREGILVAG